jgi:hypothetical protein
MSLIMAKERITLAPATAPNQYVGNLEPSKCDRTVMATARIMKTPMFTLIKSRAAGRAPKQNIDGSRLRGRALVIPLAIKAIISRMQSS